MKMVYLIKVEFKCAINGDNEIYCAGISSDPTNSDRFLLQLPDGDIMEVNYKLIKHIGL